MSIEKINKTQIEAPTPELASPPQPRISQIKWAWIAAGIAIVLLVVYPLLNQADTFGLNLLTQTLIAAIFAISFDLLFGYTGLLSFGPAAYYGLGSFGAGILIARMHISDFWLGLIVGIVLAAVGALILGFFSIRASGVYFMMLTLAFAQMLHALAFKWDYTGSSDGIPITRPQFNIFGLDFKDRIPFYLFVLVCFLGSYFLLRMVIHSPFGQALRGIRDNESRMSALGYKTRNFKLAAFIISGGLAGLAGALNVYFNGFVGAQTLDWGVSGAVLVMVLLGGKGTLIGPVLGAFFIIYTQNFIQSSTVQIGTFTLADRWLSVLGIIFILFVLLAPDGLVGLWKSANRRIKQWLPKR